MIAFALWLARFGRAQQRSKISEGFHRIGVAVGLSLFGLFSIVTFIGIFGADEGRLSMWLIYEMIGGVAVLGLYGLVRLIGWIADGFASGLKMR